MIISFPAAEEPPIIATMRLGRIAKVLVRRFRIQGVILRSRKPYEEDELVVLRNSQVEFMKL